MRAEMGTRVPVNTHVPLSLSGCISTAGHRFQSVSFLFLLRVAIATIFIRS